MFKRANKITALLVAAASVMSVVPAMAAERLGTKDGTIDSAVAFEGGKYAFYGYKSDDDDTGIYYNGGEKDTYLEDAEDYDYTGRIYGEKYAVVLDGSDEYLLDLATGKIDEDETLEDKAENIKYTLKRVLSKTDRYENVVADSDDIETLDLEQGSTFGEAWYVYTTTQASATVKDTTTGKFYGYVNDAGKYIDASKLANVYYYSADAGKVVKVEKYNDETNGLTAKLTGAPEILTQDSDYLYAKVDVQFTTSGGSTTATYLQKVSKAQGETEDDAYLPKSVTSYLIDDNKLVSGDDYSDAFDVINDANVINYQVKGSSLYVTTFDAAGDKVKTNKIDMKKVKEDSSVNAITTKLDIYVLKKDGDADNDAVTYSVDVDGNVWYLNKGTISKFDGKDKKDIFTCDRSLDKLDVYNEGSLIAWEDGEDVYTTVQEGKTVTEGEAAPATPAKVGWDKLADGTWNFYDATGAKVANNWVNVGGAWYFLKADGVMATGWLNQNGTWYYLNGSGAMATGWLNDNGTWYYLNASGAMLANTTVDGYKLGASGAWVK